MPDFVEIRSTVSEMQAERHTPCTHFAFFLLRVQKGVITRKLPFTVDRRLLSSALHDSSLSTISIISRLFGSRRQREKSCFRLLVIKSPQRNSPKVEAVPVCLHQWLWGQTRPLFIHLHLLPLTYICGSRTVFRESFHRMYVKLR
jgi:hypothetical protein